MYPKIFIVVDCVCFIFLLLLLFFVAKDDDEIPGVLVWVLACVVSAFISFFSSLWLILRLWVLLPHFRYCHWFFVYKCVYFFLIIADMYCLWSGRTVLPSHHHRDTRVYLSLCVFFFFFNLIALVHLYCPSADNERCIMVGREWYNNEWKRSELSVVRWCVVLMSFG